MADAMVASAIDATRVAAAMSGHVVVDGRNLLDPEAVRSAGLAYFGMGRRTRLPLPAMLETR